METACLGAGVGNTANKGRDGVIEFAPAWAPDSSTTHCSLCHNVRFTTFNRRVRWIRCRGAHRSRPTPDGAIVVPRWALARPSTTAASAGAWSARAAPTILFRFRRPRNGRTGCATSASLPPSAAAFGASCSPAWSVRKRLAWRTNDRYRRMLMRFRSTRMADSTASAARLAWLCDSDSDSDDEGAEVDDRRVSQQQEIRLSPYHRTYRVHGI